MTWVTNLPKSLNRPQFLSLSPANVFSRFQLESMRAGGPAGRHGNQPRPGVGEKEVLMWRKARGLCQSLDSSPGSAATGVTLARSVLLDSVSHLQTKSRN